MEKKYHGAMRRALHKFNKAKRAHDVDTMLQAVSCLKGIAYVAIEDDDIAWDDYTKLLDFRSTLTEKFFDIRRSWGQL